MSDTPKLTGIKGFDRDFSCRGFKFEIGKTYRAEGEIKACENGFHLIPADHNPLAVFGYYEPANSRFAVVEYGGATDRDGDKIAAEEITVIREITKGELISKAIMFCGRKAASNSGTGGAASNTGARGAASNTGARGAASNSGPGGAASNTGYGGAASNSGLHGAASNTGHHGAASNSGDFGAASNTGARGAASNSGARGAASNSGDCGAASNSGDCGAASNSGTYGAASNTGHHGAASNSGKHGSAADFSGTGTVRGIVGSALFALERGDTGEILSTASGIVGQGGIKPDTPYYCANGKLVEA